MKKRILKFCLVFVFLTAIFVVTKANPIGNYAITNKQEFVDYLLSNDADMEGSYILYNDLDFTVGSVTYRGTTYQLDQAGLEITPIGERLTDRGFENGFDNPFLGTFNGNGYTIKGLTIKSKEATNEYVGLFGYNNGIISNLGLVDSVVDGGIHVGGIAGYNIGTILGCYNTSVIKGIATVGGITGMNYGYVRNSYNTGFVGGTTKVGGIVGQNSSVLTAVYDVGIVSGSYTEEGLKEFGFIYGYNTEQGVVGYVEDNNGVYTFSQGLQKYSAAGAYYPRDFGTPGRNIGYAGSTKREFNNVNVVGKTLNELKNLGNYDAGFKSAKTNIRPLGSSYDHQTTGFFIKQANGMSDYPFPVVGTSEATSKHHVENKLNRYITNGKGTLYQPFVVKTESDLNLVSMNMYAYYRLANHISLTNAFTPIGTEGAPFRGIFDGNSYRISNLRFTLNQDYLGLFAFNYGVIHNLSVAIDSINSNSSKIGAIAGLNAGTIYESYAMGSIVGSNTIGGLVGNNAGGIVFDSYSLVSVSGQSDLGGIAGYSSGMIERVYATVVPSSTNGTTVGGIVGYLENSTANDRVKDAFHFSTYLAGVESKTGLSKTAYKLASRDELKKLTNFSNFDISKTTPPFVPQTTWAIEEGVNNGWLYLVGTPPIRVSSLSMDVDKEFVDGDVRLRIFDDSGTLLLGTSADLNGYTLDLNDWLLFHPTDSENRLVTWEIISQMGTFISLDGSIITGLRSGDAVIRATTQDGMVTLDVLVNVSSRVTEVTLVNKVGGDRNNPDDLIDEEITLENYTSLQFFTDITPVEARQLGIVWSVDSPYATISSSGLLEIAYNGGTNVVGGLYQSEVSFVLRATSVENNAIYDEVKIKLIPSKNNAIASAMKVRDGENVMDLVLSNGYYRANRQMSYANDFVNLLFDTSHNQTYTITSTDAYKIEDKNIYLTRKNKNLVDRNNQIDVTIFSESGIPNTYSILLTKELSPVNEIKTIAGTNMTTSQELNLGFVGNQVTILDVLPYGPMELSFDILLNDLESEYSKSTQHEITYLVNAKTVSKVVLPKSAGAHQFSIVVTSETASTKEYIVSYTMSASDATLLDDLFVGRYLEDNRIVFDKHINQYVVNLPYDFEEDIYIEATPSKDDAGNDENVVKFYLVQFGTDLDTTMLTVDAPEEGQSFSIFIKVFSMKDIEDENYEDYHTYEIQLKRAKRLSSDAAIRELLIESLVMEDSIILPGESFSYDPEKGLYVLNEAIKLDYKVSSIDMIASIHENARYGAMASPGLSSGMGMSYNVRTGKNEFTLRVKAEDNSTKDYLLVFERELSKDAYLFNLSLKDNTGKEWMGSFQKDKFMYNLGNIGNKTSELNFSFNVTPPVFGGKLATTQVYLTGGSATLVKVNDTSYKVTNIDFALDYEILIEVTSEDKAYINTYVMGFSKEKSSDSSLESLILSRGLVDESLIDSFEKETLTYHLGTLDSNTFALRFWAKPSVPTSTVSYTYNGVKSSALLEIVNVLLGDISSGNNSVIVEVVAEDQSTTTYTIEFDRQMSNDNSLVELSIVDNLGRVHLGKSTQNPAVVFIPENSDYSMNFTGHSNTVQFSAKTQDVRAGLAYSLDGATFTDFTSTFVVNLGWNNDASNHAILIRVTAEDGSTQEYRTTYDRIKDSNANIASITSSDATFVGTGEGYKATVAYNVTQTDLVVKLESEFASLSYSLDGLMYHPMTKIGDSFMIYDYVLSIGEHVLYLNVLAQDGSTKEVEVQITRPNQYVQIMLDHNEGGVVDHGELTNILAGSVVAIDFTPDEYVHLKSLRVNGVELITLVGNTPQFSDSHLALVGKTYTYTFDPLYNDQEIVIEFETDTYSIAASSNEFGSVNNDSILTLAAQDAAIILIKPNVGYHLTQVLVNGVIVDLPNEAYGYQEDLIDGVYSYTLSPSITQDYLVEAFFEVNTYLVTYYTNGKFDLHGNYVDLGNVEGTSYTVQTEVIEYNYNEKLQAKSLPTIPNMSASWNVAQDYVVTQDLNIYAGYTPYDTISLRFFIAGKEVSVVTKTLTPPSTEAEFTPSEFYLAPQLPGYQFTWFVGGEELDTSSLLILSKDLDVFGVYEKITYQINYTLDGGTNAPTNPYTYTVTDSVDLQDPTKQGYQFNGWFTDEPLIHSITKIESGSTGEKSLYAKWILATDTPYLIRHRVQALDGTYIDKLVENRSGTTFEEVTAESQAFVGFTYNPIHELNQTSGVIAADGSLELILYYTRNQYNVSIDVVGEGVVTGFNDDYSFESSLSVQATPEIGNKFLGWFVNDVLVQSNNHYTIQVPAHDVVVEARFALITYTINYVLDGGVLETENPSSYDVHTDTFTLNQPTLTGHDFVGWYTNPGLIGETIVSITQGSTTNYTLYAKYEIHNYQIEFLVSGDGTVQLGGAIVDALIQKPYGSNLTFNFVPEIDFMVIKLFVNGIEVEHKENFSIDSLNQDYVIELEFARIEPATLTLKEGSGYGNKVYSIDRTTAIPMFLNYYLSQPAEKIINSFENSSNRIKIFDAKGNEVAGSKILGTNYVIKLYKNESTTDVVDEVIVILSGDINGDGRINVADLNLLQRHIKGLTIIKDPIVLKAANVANTKVLNAGSANLLQRHVKGLTLLYIKPESEDE